MISDASVIDNSKPSSGNVVIASGHNILVKCIVNLKMANKDSNGFYFHEYTSNMLYVRKITEELDCIAIFSVDDLCFQDIKSEKLLEKDQRSMTFMF